MSPLHRKRVGWILLSLLSFSGMVALVLYALSQNINLYFTPADIAQQKIAPHQRIRLGGQVVPGSVHHSKDLHVRFSVMDKGAVVQVLYTGILPDLFQEGKGVVAAGYLLDARTFRAEEVLAKHDETYTPPMRTDRP